MSKTIICENCGRESKDKDFTTYWRVGSHLIGICRECSKDTNYMKRKIEETRLKNLEKIKIWVKEWNEKKKNKIKECDYYEYSMRR